MRRANLYFVTGAIAVSGGMAIVHSLLGQWPSNAFGLVGIVTLFAVVNWTSSHPARLGRFGLLIFTLFAMMGAMVGVVTLFDQLEWPEWIRLGLLLAAVGLTTLVGVRLLVWLGRKTPLGP